MKNKGLLFGILIFTFTIMATVFSASADSTGVNYGLVDDGYTPAYPAETSRSPRTVYPSKFDPRETNAVTPVKNQDKLGTCWAFASIGTMEQVVYKQTGLKCDYSEEALRFALSNQLATKTQKALPDIGLYKRNKSDGGFFYAAMQYLTKQNSAISNDISWLSPNLETDVPYNINADDTGVIWYDKMNTSYANAYVSGSHYERFLNTDNDTGYDENSNYYKNIQRLKRVITEYGGFSLSFKACNSSLNATTGAYYSDAYEEDGSHAVTCVGWDDNYSVDNFRSNKKPSRNGAWLIKNSWGTNGGESGFYWISYEDKNLCSNGSIDVIDEVSKVSKNEKTLSYDYTPMYDMSCWKTISPNADNAYMANIYSVSSLVSTYDSINKVTFYSSSIGANYNIYIVPLGNLQGIGNVASYGDVLATGYIDYEGFYTAHLNTPYEIPSGTSKIAVIVQYTNPTSDSLKIIYNAETNTDNNYTSCLNAGESFYTDGANSWKDLSGGTSTTQKGNFCIRPTLVRRTSITQDSTLSAYSKDYYGENVKININLNGNSLFKVTDGSGNILYQDKDFTLSSGASDGSVLRFSAKSSYLSNLNEGESRTIIFEFTDGSNQALVITHRVNIPAVYITGAASYGQTLEAYLADSYNAGDDVSYQWQRSADGSTWSNIDGATSSTYVINFNDIGKYLRVFVSAKSDGIYFYGQARTSAQKGIVTIVYGDVNLDGEVTLQDIGTINSYLNGEIEFTTHQHVLADVNGDGNINNTDILLITKFINNEIDYFPVEN